MPSTSPYALHVFSHPTAVTPSLWEKWYREEHIPDMVNSGASTQASFYRNISANPPDEDKKFLAL